jgi:uncharacterized glyoxalase superfamily protein PhnB
MTSSQSPGMFPTLRYTDGKAAIEWLCRVFGFKTHAEFANKDGSIGHAELQIGTAVVGLSSIGPASVANPWTQVREGIYLTVSDVDALHDRAKAAGADIASPLKDQEYGSREFGARDPGGHLWGFGTYQEGDGRSGEATIFVGLHYDDGQAALAWLEQAFGFTRTLEVPGPNGTLAHAEMRKGADVLMLGSSPRDEQYWRGHRQTISVWVADPDAHYARAQAERAEIIRPIANTPYGARGYTAVDLDGFVWGFSNYKPAP